ncbi:MAG: DUF4192 domain-containing protein [Actinomycetota bacterium]
MIEFESDQVVHEVLASLPFTFGFEPRESVVVTTLELGVRHVTIGASARVDLADLQRPSAPLQVDHVCAALSRTGADAAVVTIHTDREVDLWVLDLADLVTPRWPFAEHGGYYVLSRGAIHGFGPEGEPRGCHDALELLTTRVAMSEPARSFANGPEGFRFRRTSHGATAQRVIGELARCTPAHEVPDDHWAGLTGTWYDALESDGPRGATERAALLHALEHLPFRDGVLSWVLDGGVRRVGDITVMTCEDAFAHPRWPDRVLFGEVDSALRRVARYAPPGRARAPLAMAAYLAWWSGDGARARVLCEQALEEDPDYSLAGLVRDALARACPPPWYAHAEPTRIEPRSSSPGGW